MIFVPQQIQPRDREGVSESEPLLQKDLQETQPAPRPPSPKRVLKVGGVFVAIGLLVYSLFALLGPRWLHFNRDQSAHGNVIYGLPRAVSTFFIARTRSI